MRKTYNGNIMNFSSSSSSSFMRIKLSCLVLITRFYEVIINACIDGSVRIWKEIQVH